MEVETPNTENSPTEAPTFRINSSPTTIRRGFIDPMEHQAISPNQPCMALAIPPTMSLMPVPNFQNFADKIMNDALAGFNNLCITQKGLFFQDSHFENARQVFREAVKDVLKKFGRASPGEDFLGSYRDLRQKDNREETQAVCITEEDNQYKVIVLFVYFD